MLPQGYHAHSGSGGAPSPVGLPFRKTAEAGIEPASGRLIRLWRTFPYQHRTHRIKSLSVRLAPVRTAGFEPRALQTSADHPPVGARISATSPTTKKPGAVCDTGSWRSPQNLAECHKRKQRTGCVLAGYPAKHASMRCSVMRLDHKDIIVPIPSLLRPSRAASSA